MGLNFKDHSATHFLLKFFVTFDEFKIIIIRWQIKVRGFKELRRALEKWSRGVIASRSRASGGDDTDPVCFDDCTDVKLSLFDLAVLFVRGKVRLLVSVGFVEGGLQWLILREVVWVSIEVVRMKIGLAGFAFGLWHSRTLGNNDFRWNKLFDYFVVGSSAMLGAHRPPAQITNTRVVNLYCASCCGRNSWVDSCSLDEGTGDDGVLNALEDASVILILVLLLMLTVVITWVRRIMRSEWELSWGQGDHQRRQDE